MPDDVGSIAFKLEPDYDHTTSGSILCHGNWEPRFSIFLKFQPPPGRYAFTFLNITSPDGVELAITLDTCSNNITIAFGQRCGFTKVSLPYRPSAMQMGRWNKLAVSVSPDYVAMYLNCQLQQFVEINLERCQVQCDSDSVVTVIQPATDSKCNANGRQQTLVS